MDEEELIDYDPEYSPILTEYSLIHLDIWLILLGSLGPHYSRPIVSILSLEIWIWLVNPIQTLVLPLCIYMCRFLFGVRTHVTLLGVGF